MTERLSNIGYFGLIKEVTSGTPLTPTDFIPLYDENVSTNGNFVDITPAYGSKFATYQTLPGQRSFKGDITCLAEANTAARLFDALLSQGSPTGTNPYTHPFTLTATGIPPSYTYDLSLGNIVKRFYGVQVSKISPNFNKNEMQFKLSISALGSFEGREITSVTGSGPYTVTLTDPNGIFDGAPNKGLVVGDLIRFFDVSLGTNIDAVVATLVGTTQLTCVADVSTITAGDAVHLRPATTSFVNVQSFLWAKTKVCFAATASAALSAAHTPVEQGSSWAIMHSFKSDDGEDRSGSFGPATLARTIGDIDTNIKKICDTPEDEMLFNNLNKSAIIWRHFAGTPVAGVYPYELRVTLNHVKMDNPLGNLKVGELVYADHKYHPNHDPTDGQAFDVKIINALATI